MKQPLTGRYCRRQLATLWFTGSLALFLILVIQSLYGKYGEKIEEAWAWFLPNVMPTLSLIVGVLVLNASNPGKQDQPMDGFLFRLTFWTSLFYLGLIALTPLIHPFVGGSPLDLMHRSNLWLGPLQGLVAGCLGAFFVKGEKKP